jgi:hypothetical protein
MHQVREEWLHNFFSLKPTDEKEVTEGIKWIYELSKLPHPEVIFVDSPLAAQYAAQMVKEGANVWANVRVNVWNNVWVNVWVNVWDKYFEPGFYGDIWDYGWTSFYDFFDRIGISTDNFRRYKRLIWANPFYSIQLDKVCFVSRMPTRLTRNAQNQLHNTETYAIEFKDGYGQHYIHGIYFKPEDFEKTKTMTAKDIVSLKNIEQRMALLKERGAEEILNELGAKLIDGKTDMGNELFELDLGTGKQEKILRYKCPSTDRIYTKYVPPEHTRADEAQAWSHHFTLENYYQIKAQS